MRPHSFSAYGLSVRSAFEVPVASSAPSTSDPDVRLRLAAPSEVVGQWSLGVGAPVWQTTFPNDRHVSCERGQAGDHLLTFGRSATFHLDQGRGELLCAPTDPQSLSWQRFLFDTALQCTSLIRGFEALHASAICTPQGLVAFVAAPGGGKSALAAELVRRGRSLFADDVLALSQSEGKILAHPGPPLMTLPPGQCRAIDQMGDSLGLLPDDGMQWLRVRRAGGEPQPITRLFVLDRRKASQTRAIREPAGGGRLLPHMLSLNRDPVRALSRSDLLQELLVTVPVYRLQAAGAEDLVGLADVVESTLGAPSPIASALA